MKLTLTLWTLAIIAAAGCGRMAGEDTKAEDPEPGTATNVPADNTGRNERDQEMAKPTPSDKNERDQEMAKPSPGDKDERDQETAKTPGDQAENEADRSITQQIRQDVVKDDALSMNGKNVKIITVDGVVTLRGPVENQREKTSIASIVKRVDGVKRVDNQLEVAAK